MTEDKCGGLMLTGHGLGEPHLKHPTCTVFAHAVKRHQYGTHRSAKHHAKRGVEQDFHRRIGLMTAGKHDVGVGKSPRHSRKEEEENREHDLQPNTGQPLPSNSCCHIEDSREVTHLLSPPLTAWARGQRKPPPTKHRPRSSPLLHTTIRQGLVVQEPMR